LYLILQFFPILSRRFLYMFTAIESFIGPYRRTNTAQFIVTYKSLLLKSSHLKLMSRGKIYFVKRSW